MAISYTDSYGPVVDTGSGTLATARPSTEVEVHFPGEADSGSKLAPTSTLISSHNPHRASNSPR